jgi:hypothetical protein
MLNKAYFNLGQSLQVGTFLQIATLPAEFKHICSFTVPIYIYIYIYIFDIFVNCNLFDTRWQ